MKKRKVQPAAPEVETCPSPKLQRLNAMMFDQIEDSGVPGPESGPLSWTEWHDEVCIRTLRLLSTPHRRVKQQV